MDSSCRVTIMIAPISHACKRGQVKGEYGSIGGEEEGNADYRGLVQPSQKHVTSYEK